jgi:hypothetical protein
LPNTCVHPATHVYIRQRKVDPHSKSCRGKFERFACIWFVCTLGLRLCSSRFQH